MFKPLKPLNARTSIGNNIVNKILNKPISTDKFSKNNHIMNTYAAVRLMNDVVTQILNKHKNLQLYKNDKDVLNFTWTFEDTRDKYKEILVIKRSESPTVRGTTGGEWKILAIGRPTKTFKDGPEPAQYVLHIINSEYT